MAGLNKVVLVGHLGRDAELRSTRGGTSMASFTVATSDVWTDRTTGQRQESTEWHRVVLWGKQADALQAYLTKGKLVAIEGRLQTRSWDDRESGQKRYVTEVRADHVTLLSPSAGRGASDEAPRVDDLPPTAASDPITDSDIPFAWLLPLVLPVLGVLRFGVQA